MTTYNCCPMLGSSTVELTFYEAAACAFPRSFSTDGVAPNCLLAKPLQHCSHSHSSSLSSSESSLTINISTPPSPSPARSLPRARRLPNISVPRPLRAKRTVTTAAGHTPRRARRDSSTSAIDSPLRARRCVTITSIVAKATEPVRPPIKRARTVLRSFSTPRRPAVSVVGSLSRGPGTTPGCEYSVPMTRIQVARTRTMNAISRSASIATAMLSPMKNQQEFDFGCYDDESEDEDESDSDTDAGAAPSSSRKRAGSDLRLYI